jgi:hypothetical protein
LTKESSNEEGERMKEMASYLKEGGYSDRDARLYVKSLPKRSWVNRTEPLKTESLKILTEKGIITQKEFESMKYWPEKNDRTTRKAVLDFCRVELGSDITKVKGQKAWQVTKDHSKLFDELAAEILKRPKKIKQFLKKHNISSGYVKELEDRGCVRKEGSFDGIWGRA